MLTIDFSHIHLKSGDRVLDLGCGEGRHSIGAMYENPDIHVYALDLNFDDLQVAQKRHREFNSTQSANALYIQSDGCKLPFANKSFDHIICSEVLEHVPEYQSLLSEMARTLRPGGKLSISVPRYWPEKICWVFSKAYHQVEGGHIRIFKRRALQSEITQRAFQFYKQHWAHALHVPYWWLRCVFWSRGENYLPVRTYHKILVWDLMQRPALTRILERLLNPVLGKSLVMYFTKYEAPTYEKPQNKPIHKEIH